MIWLFQVEGRGFIEVLGKVNKMISRNLFILAHPVEEISLAFLREYVCQNMN